MGLWPYGKPRGGPLDPDLMGPVPYGTWALWDLSLGGGRWARTLWDPGLMGPGPCGIPAPPTAAHNILQAI